MVRKLDEQGKQAQFTHTAHVPQLRRYMKLKLKEQFDTHLLSFPHNDRALEWRENRRRWCQVFARGEALSRWWQPASCS